MRDEADLEHAVEGAGASDSEDKWDNADAVREHAEPGAPDHE